LYETHLFFLFFFLRIDPFTQEATSFTTSCRRRTTYAPVAIDFNSRPDLWYSKENDYYYILIEIDFNSLSPFVIALNLWIK
jgi:hypothetical protein